jgi:hypothetical protein
MSVLGRPQTGGIDAWPSERQPAKGAEGPPPIEPPLDGLQAYRERASHLGALRAIPQPAAWLTTRPSYFRGLSHRWWGGKFSKRTCKDAYLREVTLDRDTIRR